MSSTRSKKTSNWSLEEEFDNLQELADKYYDMIEELVEAYESIAIDLEEHEEHDLFEALERIKNHYEGTDDR